VIDRRTFLAGTGAVFLAAPLAVEAQQPGNSYRIGYLGTSPPSTPYSLRNVEAFRQGLGELGWVEGKNIVIEWRYSAGRGERFPDLAAELVRLKVNVIVAAAAPATHASKQATTTIPIVGIALSDPVGQGLVASLARPGGNVTGLATLFPELAAKRLKLLKETLPGVSRVAVLWNAANPGNVLQIGETKVAAQTLGLRLQSVEVRGPEDFQGAFAAMTRGRPEALVSLADPLIFTYQTQIVDFAAKSRLPAMHPFRESVEAGGLMAYSVNLPDMYRRAATYVDKILKGAKPGDLPVEQPTTFELVINLKTAKALGLTIPPSLLGRADEVIQ
jgi:putative ABC transport system substrate-binding protein